MAKQTTVSRSLSQRKFPTETVNHRTQQHKRGNGARKSPDQIRKLLDEARQGMHLWQSILLSAARIARHTTPFTGYDLTVAAWQDNSRFGLPGYETQHPDSHKVITFLCGKVGLVSQGYVHKEGPNIFRLTPEGYRLAKRLEDHLHAVANGTVTETVGDDQGELTRNQMGDLKRMLYSAATTKFNSARKADISYQDALHFWGLPIAPKDFTRVSECNSLLNKLTAQYEDHTITTEVIPDVTVGHVHQLKHVSQYLVDTLSRRMRLFGCKN